jgi:hypothetical protein
MKTKTNPPHPNLTRPNTKVVDLSCRRRAEDGPEGPYYVVKDKWQTYTDFVVRCGMMMMLVVVTRDAPADDGGEGAVIHFSISDVTDRG